MVLCKAISALLLLSIGVRVSQALTWQEGAGQRWRELDAPSLLQSSTWRSYSEACDGTEALEVRRFAACGVVMMAWGQSYSKLAATVASRTRRLPAHKGWCPLDPELDHIPVALFTDTPKQQLIPCMSQGVRLTEIDVHEEFELDAWMGVEGNDHLNHMLGTWKMRWYHAQSILQSPYKLSLYLDVDALPCSAHGISSLFHELVQEKALFGSTLVLVKKCHMTNGNCTFPHPPDLEKQKALEWKNFTERNSGVLVVDKKAKPILEEWGTVIKRMAGQVMGDQYALREALFKYRDTIPQHIYSDKKVCRYHNATLRECETDDEPGLGCYVHHVAYKGSLQKYNMLN